jgi:Ca2+-transporting ATPase
MNHKIENNKTEKEDFKYWKMTSEEIMRQFSQTESGYDSKALEELAKKYEPNVLAEEEKESVLEKILEQFGDPLVKILLGAAVVSFLLALTGDQNEGISAYIEPFVILLILIANATIGVWQDINADKAIDALKKLQASKCTVQRGGKKIEIDAKDLFPGDLVILNEGEKVPADARLIDVMTSNFEANESALTGESQSVYKTNEAILEDKKPVVKDMRNMIFSSTGITTGSALGIVVNTGMNTEIGTIQKLMKDAQENEEKSPLAQKLDEFGNYLTYIIGAICVIVWVINYKNFFDEIHGTVFNGMIYYFKISVALAVAAIPEGLPAVITTCFALGSRRMSANNAIVRKLDAIETLGCTSVICSDKTGTLTTNMMSVTKFMIQDHNTSRTDIIKVVTGTSFKPEGQVQEFDSDFYQNSHNLKLTTLCAAICNTSEIKKENGQYYIKGSPTEGALRVFAEKMRIYDKKHVSNSEDPMSYINSLTNEYKILFNLEFDRNRKAMSVLALDKKTNKPVLFTKGAPEILLNQTVAYYNRNGKLLDMNRDDINHINQKIKEEFMSKSLRSIALFIKEDLKELSEIDYNDKNTLKVYFKDRQRIKDLEQNLTYLGVVGMIDPPRPEVKSAISTCDEAGIRVIMITGDNKDTAEAIGTDIGILSGQNDLKTCSFTTSEFFAMSDDKQTKILSSNDNIIFSRSEPRHKMELVKKLKSLDQIVAMTGDGVNDAPALAEANIGVAMGISGTDVAKEASHIILADDNFATIVKAIEEGRSIYMNMKAFIRYLISSNIGEVVAIFITSALGFPEAFTSIQLLWVYFY